MESRKGHTGGYTGNYHRHTKVTSDNFGATKRDDEAHMMYLKEDVDYDNKHGHSDSSMTSDEKHISRLAGDLKYDEKHKGAGKILGDRNNNGVMEDWEKAISNKIKQNSGPAQKNINPNIELKKSKASKIRARNSGAAQKNIIPAGGDPDGEKDSVDIGPRSPKSRHGKDLDPRTLKSRK